MESFPTAIFITIEYPPQVGGVASYYSQLVKHLPANSVLVVSNEGNQLLHPWWKTWFVLRRHFKQFGKQPILVGQVLPLGTVAWLFSKLYHIPYLVFVHGMDVTTPQAFPRKRWLVKHILQSARVVIANSQFTAQLVAQYALGSHVEVITPGPLITPELVEKATSLQLPKKFILSVGRLVARKGFDRVIEAFKQFSDRYKDLDYVIAGQGEDLVRLQQLIMQHQLSDRVHIMSHLSNAQIATLYQGCEFLIMPSRQLENGDVEGFGVVVVEANLFGKPAIGGRAGGMTESIQDQVTGLIVDPNDPQSISQAMQHLLADTQYRHQLGAQAKQWAESQAWLKKAADFKQLLERL